ncbi:DUF2591 family protein [Xenorhabdus sp. PB61.4]|uniref:phage protein NinX family protein n=1 Tax=Xenorhabdus sp. PB61.4 TaxID=2788940 RepID=UPI001E55B411|nr:phage protein NinX family protein [Xenorhabdus sp. PB61.4]MCC8366583.1 DUF2591 family protein [Xenorhabdus sp. PB61.4]
MKIKTSELTGKALDWAVALAQGWQKMADYNGYSTPNGVVIASEYAPSWDWEVCGQLIDEYLDSLTRMCTDSPWVASCKAVTVDDVSIWKVEGGQTPKIALCRALVSAKMGDEVEIPDELLEAE